MLTQAQSSVRAPILTAAGERMALPAQRFLLDGNHRSSTLDSHRKDVERVILTMHEHLGESLSMEEMAEIAMLSPYHFNRVFRSVTGIPPAQFLWALRLQAAKRLLMTTDLSVTEICFEVGYNSLGTFTSRFTQLVGLSPTCLRNLSPEFVMSCLESIQEQAAERCGDTPEISQITGQIRVMNELESLVFVGIFPTAIPQGRPIGCALLSKPGVYRIVSIPDGRYYLFATSLACSQDAEAYLLPDDNRLNVGEGQGSLQVCNGRVWGCTDITLRPVQWTDPPILITLPYLLTEHIARDVTNCTTAEFGGEDIWRFTD